MNEPNPTPICFHAVSLPVPVNANRQLNTGWAIHCCSAEKANTKRHMDARKEPQADVNVQNGRLA